jgi:chemotaxis regulatin CheY-phosphate phosphatase CheZ
MDNVVNTTHDDAGDIGMIRDFIEHVRRIVPMLEHVKDSIEESSGKIPKASKQLSEVTTATECATVEILNVLEAMATRIGEGETHLESVKTFVEQRNGTAESSQALASIAFLQKMLSETKDNSMSIAIALQVQDITSQQIAGVSHTIESIRVQLAKALKRFDDPGEPGAAEDEAKQDAAADSSDRMHFDSDAQFSKTPDRQDLADEIVKQWKSGQAR